MSMIDPSRNLSVEAYHLAPNISCLESQPHTFVISYENMDGSILPTGWSVWRAVPKKQELFKTSAKWSFQHEIKALRPITGAAVRICKKFLQMLNCLWKIFVVVKFWANLDRPLGCKKQKCKKMLLTGHFPRLPGTRLWSKLDFLSQSDRLEQTKHWMGQS